MLKSPVLHLPDNKGRFQLFGDTCKPSTHAALYQYQRGKITLIAYASTVMPEAAKNCSITELELCVLATNIVKHLLQKADNNAVGYHLALVYILNLKQNFQH